MKIDAYCTIGIDAEYDLTSEALLKDMDFLDVDKAVIAPVDRCLAVYNRQGNDSVLKQAEQWRDRFIPAFTVNPWYGKEGVEEFKRCVSQGGKILVLHPFVQGYSLGNPIVYDIIAIAAELFVPVYIHTGTPGNATPWQVIDLAERFTGVDFIMGHCGATDFGYDTIVAAEFVSNVYLESSLARPFGFINYANKFGDDRCILGSYAPLNDMKFEWQMTRELMPFKKWPGVYGDTLLKVLERGGSK